MPGRSTVPRKCRRTACSVRDPRTFKTETGAWQLAMPPVTSYVSYAKAEGDQACGMCRRPHSSNLHRGI